MLDTQISDQPKEVNIFFSRAPVMGYVFENGKTIHFMGGIYTTEDEDEIKELTKVCKTSENYYIDPKNLKISTEKLDPLYELRKKIREEERAKLIAATDPRRDMGTIEQGVGTLKGIATSANISGLAAASQGFSGPISVATVIAKK